ncbi:hypothetical protein KJ603_02010, partial [Patescibacteria group bacterium]|nr:hypothetical protein [Patescibacteria group bacterium]
MTSCFNIIFNNVSNSFSNNFNNAKNCSEAVNIFISIKADVFGTIEAIKKEIAKIDADRV